MKNVLRRSARGARRRLAALAAVALSREACERVKALRAFSEAQDVVLYLATDGEVATEFLAAAARVAGKRIFYPAVVDGGLEFLEDQGRGRRDGRWGIPEPISDHPLKAGGAKTLLIVPGVAFDLLGQRLGRGAGAYDRALARHAAATRIGLAYEFQVVPLIPRGSWDVPMDYVVTNARVIDACRLGDGTEGSLQ